MHALDHACRATQGARDYQEDTAAYWAPPAAEAEAVAEDAVLPNASLIAVLADGMGGHIGGALASRTACEAFLDEFANAAGEPRNERLFRALEAANDAIAGKVEANPLLSGMGSTLVGVCCTPQGLEWVSVGDSPLLLYRNGEVAVLNEDHSLAPELDRLVAAGEITPEEARRDPRRHMLRSAVTGDEIDLIDISRKPLPLEPGDIVILASDGLQTLSIEEIVEIVSAGTTSSAAMIAEMLIRAVEDAGIPHQDNTTVVVIRHPLHRA